jgi:serine/threonine-protein kinase
MAQINETPPELPATVPEPVRNLVYSCIAKNPADRPASAAHLARAAQALRRGDVAAAAAAVPGILGTRSLAAAAGANYGAPTEATRVLSSVGSPTQAMDVPAEEEKKRNPWTWPLIAIIALLAIVVIGMLIALFANPSQTPPDPTSPTPTASRPSNTPSPSPSATVSDRVFLDEAQILGKTEDEVRAILTSLELNLEARDGVQAPSEDQVGLSASVNPRGNVRKGEVIVVTFYTAIPDPVATKPSSVVVPSGTYVAGDTVPITWPAYTGCPADHALSGFNFQVTNGTASVPNVVPSTATTLQVELGTPGTTTIAYTAVCTDFESPSSDPVTITVG